MDEATKQIMLRLKSIAKRGLTVGIETTCTQTVGVIEEITDDGQLVNLYTTEGKRCWLKSSAILAFEVNERAFQEAYTAKEATT